MMSRYRDLLTIQRSCHDTRILSRYRDPLTIQRSCHDTEILSQYRDVPTIQRSFHNTVSQYYKYPRYDTPRYTTIQTINEAVNHVVSLAACVVCSRIEKENIQSASSHDRTYQANLG